MHLVVERDARRIVGKQPGLALLPRRAQRCRGIENRLVEVTFGEAVTNLAGAMGAPAEDVVRLVHRQDLRMADRGRSGPGSRVDSRPAIRATPC